LKRIGLFGGTFNPIHRGHLQVIQEVRAAFELDRILLIPAALPPHKEPRGVADARDRMHMIKLAVSNDPTLMQTVTVSDVELERPGPSYSIDTVRYFWQKMSEETELYFILGLDAFLEINTWKSFRDLFLLIPFIVMTRANARHDDDSMRQVLGDYLQSKISNSYRFSAPQSCYLDDEKEPVFIFKVTPIDISSTKIREFVKKGSGIESMVPGKVADFIKTKGLYL
jgi:nicotinate-nucleotide adenylyltransferase